MKRGALVAALLLVASVAHADTPPSVWDRAKSPSVADEYELHQAVQRRLFSAAMVGGGSEIIRPMLEAERMRAYAMLQSAGAEKSQNPLLRFDLGEVLFSLDQHGRAAEVLRGAIAEFPRSPQVDRAWLLLAFACGHTGDHACERTAYHEVQRRQTEESHLETPALNLAETEMHQGDLREAIEGYREALDLSARSPGDHQTTRPLALFGLAVAFDRAGDRIEAEKNAAKALEAERNLGVRLPMVKNGDPGTTRSILQSRDVFFVPDYEVNWYLALEAIAAAKRGTSAHQTLAEWQSADRYFTLWVKGAEKATVPDRWLPIAKARLAQVKIDLSRAEAAAAKEPPKVHVERDPNTLRL